MVAGGFNLHKWKSNFPEFVQKIEFVAVTTQTTTSIARNVEEEDETYPKAIMSQSLLRPSYHTTKILG